MNQSRLLYFLKLKNRCIDLTPIVVEGNCSIILCNKNLCSKAWKDVHIRLKGPWLPNLSFDVTSLFALISNRALVYPSSAASDARPFAGLMILADYSASNRSLVVRLAGVGSWC